MVVVVVEVEVAAGVVDDSVELVCVEVTVALVSGIGS